MDLPADVQGPAPAGGDGQEAAFMWLELPDRRRERRVPHDFLHGGISEIARFPENVVSDGQSTHFRMNCYTNDRSSRFVTYPMILVSGSQSVVVACPPSWSV